MGRINLIGPNRAELALSGRTGLLGPNWANRDVLVELSVIKSNMHCWVTKSESFRNKAWLSSPDKMGCRQLSLFVQSFNEGLGKNKRDTTFCPAEPSNRIPCNFSSPFFFDWFFFEDNHKVRHLMISVKWGCCSENSRLIYTKCCCLRE